MGVDKERIDGFRKGFGNEEVIFMKVSMHKKERRIFYEENLEIFKKASAVFAVSDYYAIDLLQYLSENHFEIPKDISIAGFDDIPLCEMITPTLTTVRQDGALRAKLAVQKLYELKEGRETENKVQLPVQLVVRGSIRKI